MTNLKPLTIFVILLISLSPFVYADEGADEGDEISSDSGKETAMPAMAISSFTGDPARDYLHGSAVAGGSSNTGGIFQTNLFTGAATYVYPIKAPPGTNGLQPQINLVYNNQDTKRRPDLVGKGWSLSQSYIQRDVNYTPTDASDDKFKLFINGNKYDLVYSGGRYHTKIESFLYIRELSGGNNQKHKYWITKTKDGTTYRFGYNQDSELVSNQHNYVTRWSLDLITDTHGNNIYYSYQEDPNVNDIGTVYPNKIEYNNDKKREIEFVLESSDRPDIWTLYEQGHKISYSRRLKEIIIKANNELVHKYVLEYNTLGNANSLLSNMTFYGEDGATNLPPTKFSYYHNKGWNQDNSYNPPMDFIKKKRVYYNGKSRYIYFDSGARLADINRDGKVDYLDDDYCPRDFTIDLEIYDDVYIYGADNGVRLADVNGDGHTDCIYADSYSAGGAMTWLGPPKHGWWWPEHNDTWTSPVEFSGVVCYNCDYWDYGGEEYYSIDEGCRVTDINRDSLADIICGYSNGGHREYLNNGNGWTKSDSWVVPTSFVDKYSDEGEWFYGDSGLRVVDINCDDLPDLLESNDAENTKNVWINDGTNWIEDNSWGIPVYFINNDREDNGVRFADVNGDCLTDILTNNGAYINNGNGWSSDSSWNSPTDFVDEDKDNEGVKLGDVNGDGVVDVIKAHPNDDKATWLSNGDKNFLLKEINNSLGGSTIINYKKSTSLSGNSINFNMWVVESVTQNNGIEGIHNLSLTQNYDYSGGFYDYEEKELRGFNYVEEIKPDGTRIKHYFHQDNARKGTEYKSEAFDNNENPYQKIERGWSYIQQDNFYITQLANETFYTYDETYSNPKIKQAEYEYDIYGNIIKTSSLGDVNQSGDEKYDYVEYLYNTGSWIVNKPKHSYTYDSDDTTKLKESWFRYDNRAYDQYPTKGDLTYVEYWLNTGPNPIESYGYDSYGNVISYANPRGYITGYSYDPTCTFLIRTTNAKNHQANYTYELGTGNLLSVTDTNGYLTKYKYDVFGRKIKEVLPYDSENNPTKEIAYNFNGIVPEKIIVKQKENNQSTLDIYYFYDGFGNLLQLKRESEGLQLITQDYYYDELGRLKQESNPYYSEQGYTAPNSSLKKTSYSYDTLGRQIQIINPDNTQGNIDYNHWITGVYDENNHRKDYIEDSYGNTITVREYNDGEVYTTDYDYDVTGNLLKITDNQGNQINYTYDSLGRKIQLDDPGIGTWNYVYDKNNNLIQQTDGKGTTIYLGYDELDRMANKTGPSLTINYVYDQNTIGTLSGINMPELTINYEYDQHLRKTNEEKIIDGITFTTSFSYDSLDRVTSKTLPDGSSMSYTYNNQGLLENIGGILADIDYNEFDQPNKRGYSNSIIAELSYYPDNSRLKKIKIGNKQDLNYVYDNVGNIVEIQDMVDNKVETFEYDDLDRLTKATKITDQEKEYEINYSYDSIGNMLELLSNLYNMTFEYSLHSPILINIMREENCIDDSECDDNLYCNGQETCQGELGCQAGTAPNCDDNIGCTDDSCDETNDICVNDANDANCDDGVGCTDDACDALLDCQFAPDDANCDDSLWCNGYETCDALLDCQAGTAVDCSGNDLPEIATCTNNPDANPFTWDYFAGFTSTCNEYVDECTTGTVELTHTCSVNKCNAECDSNDDCQATECDNLDGCYNGIYRDYNDVNACLDDCGCETNSCTDYTEEADNDGDGYSASCGDCNDNNPYTHPGAAESCNDNIDNNCDGSVDEGCVCTDGEGRAHYCRA